MRVLLDATCENERCRRPSTFATTPHALADPDAVLVFLLTDLTWDERMRARRTASAGLPYSYAGQRYDAVPMPPQIAVIGDRARRSSVDNCLGNYLANLYEAEQPAE